MSSDEYYRQISVTNIYYNVLNILVNANTLIYEFVPISGELFCNLNYPPGYMQLASSTLLAAIGQTVASQGGIDCFVLRDMGKTIYAATSADATSFSYFRMVQLVCPPAIPAFGIYNNQLGGPSGSGYGIFGAPNTPDAYTNYTTFYIPVTVGGVGLGVSTKAYLLAGGQM